MIVDAARKLLVAYDASDRDIPDSDLDDEQPLSLYVRLTLGDIRALRRALAMIDRGGELVAADLKRRAEYDASL